MNIRAKQIQSIDTTRMDVTTVLSYMDQMKTKIAADATLTSTMGSVWTAFTAAYTAFDDAYAQTRKWAQTEDISALDTQRDNALSAYLSALKAMTASPNQEKQQKAKYLQFIRDKYTLSAADEYMKETTAISQMIQELEGDAQATAALTATGLDDWLLDLKTKNNDFLAKMNERTESQAGQQKGIVRETRLQCEAAYRDVVKLINALAIVEIPAGYAYATIIDLLNAEIDHYRQILARKGSSSGSGSGNQGNGQNTPGEQTNPETPGGSGEGSESGSGEGEGSGSGSGEGSDEGSGSGEVSGSGSGGGQDNPTDPTNPGGGGYGGDDLDKD